VIVFHLRAETAFNARVCLLLRVPDGFGSSVIAVRCDDRETNVRLRGNLGIE
jgi:hypothetical protein